MESALRDVLQYSFRGPGQFNHSRSNLFVDGSDSLLEKSSLVRLEAADDSVVVSNDEHHALSEHTELFGQLVDAGGKVGYLEPQPLPAPHFIEQLLECPAEVASQHP